jgi:hypothetical protein
MKLRQQLRQHSVAFISLAVALSSLAYNSWRNEKTEDNRNIRAAGVELLLTLGELERVVFFSRYDEGDARGNPREGWAYVLTVRDMASLTAAPAISASVVLLDTWESNWSGLGEDEVKADRISVAIDELRSSTLEVLASLD